VIVLKVIKKKVKKMKVADKTRVTERLHVMVSKHTKSKLANEAKDQGVAISEVVRVAVDEYFEKDKNKRSLPVGWRLRSKNAMLLIT
jgi:post-segregation antitoxin (ccd killing protein)